MSDARKSGNRFSARHRDQGGLDFWARRKAAVEAEMREEERRDEAAQRAEHEAALAERSDEDILAELNLPDPDSLGEGDDFKAFLQDAVPARIRTRALRRLWRVNPVLANVDGLIDYGEDFNDASFVVENMQTAYQVGKGMTKHVLDLARQATEEAEDAGLPDDQPDTPPGTPPDGSPPPAPEPPVLTVVETAPLPEEPEPIPQTQRRMRFAFDQEAT
ncbi:DUF3306 domain-containing protein [Aliiroseovarius sp.]|uniref:DUF3306 domain-containing protein n=1 Tax=Aliiroseovarius sp. TaxID=1872442 RepID=UPI00263725BF|nr:DUF3306 domain-containing protein [Aliiroseovarius sp.]